MATRATGTTVLTSVVEGVEHLVSEQARLVKTVKVHIASAEGGYGSDRRIPSLSG